MVKDPYAFEDDDDKQAQPVGQATRFKEFDCPSCNANNPCDPPIGDGDEVLCNYCGQELRADVDGDGRLRLRLT